jgi:hypothetical protein
MLFMHTIDAKIADKFCGLLYSLTQSKNEFEMVADEVEDCNLRTALQGISTETDLYANEIVNQLKTLGINEALPPNFLDNCTQNVEYPEDQSNGKGNELLAICNYIEQSVTKAYWNILNEPVPFPTLRDILTYQLNSLKYAFMKIKMLNSARFAS